MTTTLIGRERVGDAELSANKSQFTYSETYDYLVISNDVNEEYWDVITTTGLPDVFITDQGGMRCVSKSASRDPLHAGHWHVKCRFSSETVGQDTSSNDPDPETWIPIWTADFETYPEVMNEDTTGRIWANSANCKFPEPLTLEKPLIVFKFSQYEPYNLSLNTIAARNETINDDTFAGFATWTLKCNIRGITRGLYFNYPKTKVDYTMSYKPNEWTKTQVNVGYEYYVNFGDPKRAASPKLVNLAADGTLLDDDVAPSETVFYPWEDIDFSTFIRT